MKYLQESESSTRVVGKEARLGFCLKRKLDELIPFKILVSRFLNLVSRFLSPVSRFLNTVFRFQTLVSEFQTPVECRL